MDVLSVMVLILNSLRTTLKKTESLLKNKTRRVLLEWFVLILSDPRQVAHIVRLMPLMASNKIDFRLMYWGIVIKNDLKKGILKVLD